MGSGHCFLDEGKLVKERSFTFHKPAWARRGLQPLRVFLVLLLMLPTLTLAETTGSSTNNKDSVKKGSGVSSKDNKEPVYFRPNGKAPDLRPVPRAKAKVARLQQRKSDVVTLPFRIHQFTNVRALLAALQKYMPRANQRELARIALQLSIDPVPVPPDLGGIFVPNIINRSDVTAATYTVFNANNRPVAISQTGKKSFVIPGNYTVRVGRLGNEMLPLFKVTVKKGMMTVIRSRWAALIIRVVDERLIQFRGTYDIIHLNSRRGIGTGIGADDTLGEKVRPWLVPKGTYMIVRVGDSYLARSNYFTVRVSPGKVTYFRLVIDRNANTFLGGGVLLGEPTTQRVGAWRWSMQLSGNVLFNYAQNVSGNANGPSFSMAAFFFGRALFNQDKHFFMSTLSAELGFTLPTQGNFQKSADRIELQGIYVFRVLSWLGPYLRAGFESVMLPDWYQFTDEDRFTRQDVSIYHCESAACDLQRTVKVTSGEQLQQLQLSDIFDPILLKQGLGLNIQPVRSPWIDLRILFGLGFRQEITRGVYQFDPNEDVATKRCKNLSPLNPNPTDLTGCPLELDQENHTSVLLFKQNTSHREGLEIAIVATGTITRYISYTFEFDALMPFEFSGQATFINFNNFEIDGRLTVIFRLSHYASLNFRLRVRRNPLLATNPNDPESSRWSIDLSNALAFSLLF